MKNYRALTVNMSSKWESYQVQFAKSVMITCNESIEPTGPELSLMTSCIKAKSVEVTQLKECLKKFEGNTTDNEI